MRLGLFASPGKAEVRIGSSGAIEYATRQYVSGSAFDLLGVPPAVGRLFSKEEDAPGQHAVVVLSHEYWMRRFGGDPGVIGRRIEVFGRSFVIQGVPQEGFFGVEPGKFIDIWTPAATYGAQALKSIQWFWFQIVGRLEGDTNLDQVQARLQPGFHDL